MGMMNKTRKTFAVAALSAAVAAGIQGCSADDPDSGSGNLANNISGIAVDGYLAEATVFVDINNNGERDPGEPFAETDPDGYFTTGKDGTNYCATDVDPEKSKYCLRAFYADGSVVLRTVGGTDLSTGLDFKGSLSAEVVATAGENIQSKVISPITTLLTNTSDPEKEALTDVDKLTILSKLGVMEDQLDDDFLGDDYSSEAVNAALKLHKIVTVLTGLLEENYGEIGDDEGIPNTTNQILYFELAKQLADQGSFASNVQTMLASVLDAAEEEVRDLYTEENLPLPSNISLLDKANATSDGESISTTADNILDASATASNVEERAIAIELLTEKMLIDSSDLTDVTNLVNDTSSTLYDTLQDANNEIFFDGMKKEDFSAGPDLSVYDISNAPPFIVEQPPESLGNKQIALSYTSGDMLVSGEAIVYFTTESSENPATTGAVEICIMYDDQGEQSDLETAGTLYEGTWSVSIEEDKLLHVDVSGFDAKIMSIGMNNYAFDYDDEILTWSSSSGLIDNSLGEPKPADDAACEAMFQG